MFYSPFEVCEVCKGYVLLDQTQQDCAREHNCQAVNCPLKQFFAKPYAPSPDDTDGTESPPG